MTNQQNNINNEVLLFELQTEELPPKALKNISEALTEKALQMLEKFGFIKNIENNIKGIENIEIIATPRRIGFMIQEVSQETPPILSNERLLPLKIAFENIQNLAATDLESLDFKKLKPNTALLKKLQSLDVALNSNSAENASENIFENLVEMMHSEFDGKQYNLHIKYHKKSKQLAEIFAEQMPQILQNLPIPKVMSYQKSGQTYKFVRPVKNIIAMHGQNIIPFNAFGVDASNKTLGHRFMGQINAANPSLIEIDEAKNYTKILKANHVTSTFSERRVDIIKQLIEQAHVLNAELIAPEALLDEVCSLVEYPQVYTCTFDQEFLQVPQECLILTMQTNQKYFALTRDGKLINQFLIVSNINSTDKKWVIEGNEKVIRPRLADAAFFYKQDRKKPLIEHAAKLEKIIYQQKLGSQSLRLERIEKIAIYLNTYFSLPFNSDSVKEQEGLKKINEQIKQTAKILKADLCTDMVGEFPELQGVIGNYYAKAEGYDEAVADALEMHYHPRFSGDTVATNALAILFALAEKLETIVGIFLVGLQPTAEKDPYALRRHALGVLRTLLENTCLETIQLDSLILKILNIFKEQKELKELFENEAFKKREPTFIVEITDFIDDRLRAYLKQAYPSEVVDAVLAEKLGIHPTILMKLNILHQQYASLAIIIAVNKRIVNIIKKQRTGDYKSVEKSEKSIRENSPKYEGQASNVSSDRIYFRKSIPLLEIDYKYLSTQEVDFNLCLAYKNIVRLEDKQHLNPSSEEGFKDYLKQLEKLGPPLADFFENVMVMDDDLNIREQRLNLLVNLYRLINRVVKFECLA